MKYRLDGIEIAKACSEYVMRNLGRGGVFSAKVVLIAEPGRVDSFSAEVKLTGQCQCSGVSVADQCPIHGSR